MLRAEEISSIIRSEIEKYGQDVRPVNVGTVFEIGDGIARVYGLANVMASEIVEIEADTPEGPATVNGMAYNLEEENVGVGLMGSADKSKEGDTGKRTNISASSKVGEGMLADGCGQEQGQRDDG